MTMRITSGGHVEYVKQGDDGTKERRTFSPGDIAEASKYLDAEEMAEVMAVWTPAFVKKWRDEQTARLSDVDPNPRKPDVLERLAAIEAATLEDAPANRLALARSMYKSGTLTDQQLDGLVQRGRLTAQQAAAIRAG